MQPPAKPKILICDDEIDILDLCHTLLHSSYNLIMVTQCGNILETIKKFKPDIIFMDLWLCEERGEDVIRQIQSDETFRSLPILLFSARDGLDQLTEELGVSDYLSKPFTGRQLQEKIESTLQKHPRVTST